MAKRLNIGVIGLGRRWPRFQKALERLPNQARVDSVYDPAAATARAVSSELECAVAEGVTELIESDSVEAVLLTGGMWSGLWAAQQAARLGKPILCAGSLLRDEEHADKMVESIPPDAPIHMTLWPALELLLDAASSPLGESLGDPQLAVAGHSVESPIDPLDGGGALALLSELARLFESEPVVVSARSPESQPGLVSASIRFANDCAAELSLWSGSAIARSWVEIDAESGWLRAELPRSLTWHEPDGRRTQELPQGIAEVWALSRFLDSVRTGREPTTSFAQAYQALTWLRALRRSREESGAEVEIA